MNIMYLEDSKKYRGVLCRHYHDGRKTSSIRLHVNENKIYRQLVNIKHKASLKREINNESDTFPEIF